MSGQEPERGNLAYRVRQNEKAISGIQQSLKVLITIQVRYEQERRDIIRAFELLNDHETRLRKIESEMPVLNLFSGAFIRGVLAICGVVGIALITIHFVRG